MKPNHHLNDQQILGYLYRTLSDADRETMDHHLVNCPVCRDRINQAEIQGRQITNELKAEINGATIPDRLSFSAIASKLGERRTRRFWSGLSSSIPLATAVIGLLLAFFGLWQTLGDWTSITILPKLSGAYPALACFFFMFVSMGQFDRAFSIRPRFILTVILAALLWLGTFIIGFLNLLVVVDLVVTGYLVVGGDADNATVIGILAAMIAAMAYIGVVIGGAEYHYKNIGQPASWKLFTWTLIIQLFIMVLPYFLL
jgi:predicted anti-sigma-YlaC factor YlaD